MPHLRSGVRADNGPRSHLDVHVVCKKKKKRCLKGDCPMPTPVAWLSSQTAHPVAVHNPASKQGRGQVTITHSTWGDRVTGDPVRPYVETVQPRFRHASRTTGALATRPTRNQANKPTSKHANNSADRSATVTRSQLVTSRSHMRTQQVSVLDFEQTIS